MQVQFDFLYLVGAAVSVVGVIEWAKGFFPKINTVWWRVALAPACALVAWAGDGGAYQIATNAFALLALTQVGYPLLVQLPTSVIGAFKNKIGGQ